MMILLETKKSATIVGIGAYIPDEIRTNDYWSADIIQQWNRSKNTKHKNFLHLKKQNQSDSVVDTHPLLEEELKKLVGDPFVGMKERRVSHIPPSEMEVIACKEALEDAQLKPEQIDLLMGFSLPPDRINPPNIYKVHHELGLINAMCYEVSAMCHSFLVMLDIAYQYIKNGTMKNILIFVSTKYSSVMDYTSSVSTIAGDGAVAVVLSCCGDEKGLQILRHKFDTSFYDCMIAKMRAPLRSDRPSSNLDEEPSGEKIFFTLNEPDKARIMMSEIPLWSETIRKEFESSGYLTKKVDFMVTNAAMVWYSKICAKIFEVSMENVEDNILKFANMGAVNLPMNLYTAYKKNRLSEGSSILMFGHGGGASYGGAVLKWHKQQ